ncbi:MAG: TIM barrel protein [Planctomycetaceae bacterium]|jgi:hydroxypyruvate isomerase|nr:TIM barrel protein [Planctomycetaceae bacterium]
MSNISRRSLLKTLAIGGAAVTTPTVLPTTLETLLAQNPENSTAEQIEALTVQNGTRQSVCKWCYNKFPMEEFCKIAKKLGLVGIDLVGPNDWDLLLKYDLIVTMGNGPGMGIPKGFNRLENHDKLIESYEAALPIAAEKKVPNLICFSGNREGISDDEGLANCVTGLKRLMPAAEKYGVTIVMELLNSKDHKDYQADHTPWSGELARQVGSERFKLLYDIYHMQRMEGDVIKMIRDYKDVIGHYHTGGNPGRNDIDETQELYYPAIIKAIKATGFKGFIAHEFLPKKGLESLRNGIKICDV